MTMVTQEIPWLVDSDRLGGWWVTEGEWKPGHPELVKGRFGRMEDALQAARDHNARIARNGRPTLPFTKAVVRHAMVRSDWNVSKAAEILGVHRNTLHRWLSDRMAEVQQNPPVKLHSGKKRTPKRRSK